MTRTAKPRIEYTGNSELRAVEGWCCKTCNRFWGDSQHMACWCCATHVPCKDCGQWTEKTYTHCEACRSKMECERFDKLDAKPYDGSVVCQYDDHRFFFDEDELLEYLAEIYYADDERGCDGLMLVFAEGRKPKWRHDVSELVCDDLDPDSEWDTSEIDRKIAEWVESNAPTVYWPTKIRVDVQSLIALVNKEKAEGRWPA